MLSGLNEAHSAPGPVPEPAVSQNGDEAGGGLGGIAVAGHGELVGRHVLAGESVQRRRQAAQQACGFQRVRRTGVFFKKRQCLQTQFLAVDLGVGFSTQQFLESVPRGVGGREIVPHRSGDQTEAKIGCPIRR